MSSGVVRSMVRNLSNDTGLEGQRLLGRNFLVSSFGTVGPHHKSEKHVYICSIYIMHTSIHENIYIYIFSY